MVDGLPIVTSFLSLSSSSSSSLSSTHSLTHPLLTTPHLDSSSSNGSSRKDTAVKPCSRRTHFTTTNSSHRERECRTCLYKGLSPSAPLIGESSYGSSCLYGVSNSCWHHRYLRIRAGVPRLLVAAIAKHTILPTIHPWSIHSRRLTILVIGVADGVLSFYTLAIMELTP